MTSNNSIPASAPNNTPAGAQSLPYELSPRWVPIKDILALCTLPEPAKLVENVIKEHVQDEHEYVAEVQWSAVYPKLFERLHAAGYHHQTLILARYNTALLRGEHPSTRVSAQGVPFDEEVPDPYAANPGAAPRPHPGTSTHAARTDAWPRDLPWAHPQRVAQEAADALALAQRAIDENAKLRAVLDEQRVSQKQWENTMSAVVEGVDLRTPVTDATPNTRETSTTREALIEMTQKYLDAEQRATAAEQIAVREVSRLLSETRKLREENTDLLRVNESFRQALLGRTDVEAALRAVLPPTTPKTETL